MKAVILAGGRGTRLAEENAIRPKPMVTIGGRPILWHLMHIYSAHGVTEFIVCLGYKGYVIKEYFENFLLHSATTASYDFENQTKRYEHAQTERWRVTLVETGDATETGGRIKRIRRWVEDDPAFYMTYGDGLADTNITALKAFHFASGKHATMTVVSPPGRFGAVEVENGAVTKFVEKPKLNNQAINGGFFVLSSKIFDYIEGDSTTWEHGPLETLAAEGQLAAFHHRGFWQPMDTIREREILEHHWASGSPPWMVQPDGSKRP